LGLHTGRRRSLGVSPSIRERRQSQARVSADRRALPAVSSRRAPRRTRQFCEFAVDASFALCSTWGPPAAPAQCVPWAVCCFWGAAEGLGTQHQSGMGPRFRYRLRQRPQEAPMPGRNRGI